MRFITKQRAESAPDESRVITKATLRAADRLGIKNTALAKIIGLSEPTISRMYKGTYVLPPESKNFELAVLFVRFYRSLDGIIGGDDSVAADWLKNKNTVLDGVPLELIQSVSGLTNAIEYLDSRRAIV
jgi:Antitoxin Xre-like helix-turn-helix domain/Antitoxin Xre/MbcA/ParS C-terminal toxin-binding domain